MGDPRGNTPAAPENLEPMPSWTPESIKIAREILESADISEYQAAVKRIAKALKMPVTLDSLYNAFRRAGIGAPSAFCQTPDEEPEAGEDDDETTDECEEGEGDGEEEGSPCASSDEEDAPRPSRQVKKLIDVAARGALSFEALCDKMALPPGRMRQVLNDAKDFGVQVRLHNDHIGVVLGREHQIRLHQAPVISDAPKGKSRYKVGVLSDTHFGSHYCMRKQIREFVEDAYASGVREFVHVGDVLDGDYRHGKFEMSHMGLTQQTRDLFEHLPQLPGLSYHGITGNHDYTYSSDGGVDVGDHIEGYFAKRGRRDVHFYGDRSAYLMVGGLRIHLWHPKKGPGKVRSSPIQSQIKDYPAALRPDVLLIGHWHVFCHVEEQDVHGIACPTFQAGGSAFGNSLGGQGPAVGGLILEWGMAKDGTLRDFEVKRRRYNDVHQVHDVTPEAAVRPARR